MEIKFGTKIIETNHEYFIGKTKKTCKINFLDIIEKHLWINFLYKNFKKGDKFCF